MDTLHKGDNDDDDDDGGGGGGGGGGDIDDDDDNISSAINHRICKGTNSVMDCDIYRFSKLLQKGTQCNIFNHSVFCLTTGPKPPLKRFLHIVRSRASSFK